MPVTYVELSDDEERLVLASLDPLAAMASAEQEQLAALLEGLDPADDAIRAITAQAHVLVADLIEPARATTLDQLDEGRRGLEIATAWLRSKASRAVVDRDPAAPDAAPQ